MKEEPKKWSLFDIVGIYSSGVKMTLKARKPPMEATQSYQPEVQYFMKKHYRKNCETRKPNKKEVVMERTISGRENNFN